MTIGHAIVAGVDPATQERRFTQEGRPSKSLHYDQAEALLTAAEADDSTIGDYTITTRRQRGDAMNTAASLLVIAFLFGVIAALLAGFLTWISAKNTAKALLTADAAFCGHHCHGHGHGVGRRVRSSAVSPPPNAGRATRPDPP